MEIYLPACHNHYLNNIFILFFQGFFKVSQHISLFPISIQQKNVPFSIRKDGRYIIMTHDVAVMRKSWNEKNVYTYPMSKLLFRWWPLLPPPKMLPPLFSKSVALPAEWTPGSGNSASEGTFLLSIILLFLVGLSL